MLYLINAIYFYGAWTKPFDNAATRDRSFTLLDGSEKMHPMMYQDGRYRYLRGEGFEAVALPYGDESMSMYVFLPDRGSSLAAFLGTLGPDSWEQWMEGFRSMSGSIVLPRFTVEYGIELADVLTTLGMGIAFDAEEADFSLMSPLPLYIGRVMHKTFVEVNEQGTEAAAATSVEMLLTAVRPSETFSMVVDRPFFCAIRDDATGALLFIGAVVDPQ
jgi:serpin B